jgi:hypothetical protein
MGFGFRNIEHAFASIAKDTVKTATLFSAIASRVEKAAPEVEALTEMVYPPAVLIERAAFGLLGMAANASTGISDATKAGGVNLTLDEQAIKELQQNAAYLKGRLGSLSSFEDKPATAPRTAEATA